MCGQSLSDGAGLLGPQVQWDVLLALIERDSLTLTLSPSPSVSSGASSRKEECYF